MSLADYRTRLAEVLAGDRPAKVPYPIGLREATVLRGERRGSGLVRLTFGGVDDFVSHVADEHIRLVFPGGDGVLRLPVRNGLSLDWPTPRPVSREYSVRDFRPEAGELDVEFVVHPGGLASEFAQNARPGDTVHIAGPPGGVVVPFVYDTYLFAGDLSALPAIARWLESLPRDARGWAVVQVSHPDERVALAAPPGVGVLWVASLADAVRDVPVAGRTYYWISGEAGDIKPLRRWVREVGAAREDVLITGYWKRGAVDYDEHED